MNDDLREKLLYCGNMAVNLANEAHFFAQLEQRDFNEIQTGLAKRATILLVAMIEVDKEILRLRHIVKEQSGE